MGNKIVIEITDAREAPKVTINGEPVKVKDVEYYYETETDVNYGTHELLMSVANEDREQFDKIGFEK